MRHPRWLLSATGWFSCRTLSIGCLALCSASYASPASAQARAGIKQVAAVAPASGGQPALAVGFDASGMLRAAICQRVPCSVASGESLELPAEAQTLATAARLMVVRLGQGRQAIHVEIPDPARQRSWEAVVLAAPRAARPNVVFRGWTGLVQGEYGLRRGPMVMVSGADRRGTRSIVIGEQREDLTLCGRPAVIAPQLLLPSDLKLHPAKVQRLSRDDRATAVVVAAERVPEDAASENYPVLRAVAATSAVGQPGALTDGDLNTTWAENRGGDGRGEFVLMQAPPQLPIEGFEVTIRPPQAEVEHGVSPKQFFIVTTPKVYRIGLPEDAWQHPGARYRAVLPEPVQTDCVALVTETAYQAAPPARVTFAELQATTAFAKSSVQALAAALAGGKAGAVAAGSVLRSLGPEAFAAVAKAFDGLDEGGRRVALDVIDHAPCATSVPVYLRALVGPFEAHRHHARARLRGCGRDTAELFVQALLKSSAKERVIIAEQLALVAPARAVEVLVPMLGRARAKLRRDLRAVLAHARDSPRVRDAVAAALSDPKVGAVATIDLLRALGDRAGHVRPAASRAFARLATPQASFRTRYLLLGPAAVLAATDPSALSYLRRALVVDRNPHIRAQAARVVRRPAVLQSELLRALADSAVRVREAAVRTLSDPRAAFAGNALQGRLRADQWPLVRAAAAEALAELGPSPAHDRALFEAMRDPSEHVRVPVILALGRRQARVYAPAVRARLLDRDEALYVRVAAATSLGLLCDRESVNELTDFALLLADPLAAGPSRGIAPAALAALGRIRPSDLPTRLEPLLSKEAPIMARHVAQAALSRRRICPR